MTAKTLLRTLALLAALLVLWGGFVLVRNGGRDSSQGLALPALTATDIDRITIAGPADTAALEAGPSGWTVNGKPASGTLVQELITSLADSDLTSELTARSAGSHERLGVDSASGRHVRFAQGDKILLDLVLGGSGPAYQSVFARRADQAETYLMRGRFTTLMARKGDEWRDREIASVTGDSVTGIRIGRGRGEIALDKRGDGWHLGGAPADSLGVKRLLGALRPLSAAGFPSDSEAARLDFSRPKRRLTLLQRADTLLSLAFDSTAGGIWVRRAGGGQVYKLDFWRLDQLTPSDTAFRSR